MRESQAAAQLPSQVANYGVTVQKSTSAPLLLVAVYSPHGTYDAQFLANYAYINLNDPVTRVPGVANVQIFGAGQYAMRIWLDPDTLARLGITVSDVINALESQNTVNPAGQLGGRTGAPGSGIHLFRAGAGTPGDSQNSSATSCSAKMRVAAWCESKTSRGSSWACSTTP